MNRSFNVLDFGAVPDGVTDSTTAIQSAIDAAPSHSEIIVPPGTYSIGKLYLRGEDKAIVGCSAWSFRRDGASVFKLNISDVDCMIDITDGFGCAIRGMCMCGEGLGERIHGVKLYREAYNGGGEEDTPTIDDCRIGGFSGDGVHLERVWCFSIRHSMLHRNDGAGLFIDGWDAFIIDNWFSGNAGGGILGGRIVASVTCTGNRVEWNHRGGFIFPSGDSFNLTGNFFDRSFGPALELGSEGNLVELVTVTGNIFRRIGARSRGELFEDKYKSSHLTMRNCRGVVVTGNAMKIGRDDGDCGIYSPEYSIMIRDCRDCIVKDNTMSDGALTENVVQLGTNDNCSIENNIGRLAK